MPAMHPWTRRAELSLIVIGGDAVTTTVLALAAGWPEPPPDDLADGGVEVVVVEADPSGGSLAAWLDTSLSPSLSSVVTALHQGSSTGATRPTQWSTIDTMVRRSTAGVRFIPAPFRAREARGAIGEADLSLFPLLAALDHTVALVDVGRLDPLRLPTAVRHADLTVVVHRQDSSSAAAATVRLERLAETTEALRDAGVTVALALVGEDPFPLGEVADFASPGGPAFSLAPDALSAAVLAGRTGVSSRRLARLPLMRSAAHGATELARLVRPPQRSEAFANGGAA
jgi:hypothetical protein